MINELKEVWNYRQMLYATVKKDLRSRYRGSFFGFLWTFINPLMQLIIYSVVFPFLLKMKEDNYPMFIFIGLLPWIFFTSSLQISTTCIVANGNLVKKIYFPRMILPLSVVSTGLMNYIFGLVVVFSALMFTGVFFSFYILWLPVIILIQYVFTAGICLILSSLYVLLRDLEHIVAIITMAWFYVTPIVFNITIFPPKVQYLLKFNPMTQFVMAYRDIMLYKHSPDFKGLLYISIFSVLIFLVGGFIFHKIQRIFAEEI